MTMKSKLTAIVISALTLTASASDHHDEKKGKKKSVAEKAKPAKVEGKRKLPPHMAKFDKNKDGKLCDAEILLSLCAFVATWIIHYSFNRVVVNNAEFFSVNLNSSS